MGMVEMELYSAIGTASNETRAVSVRVALLERLAAKGLRAEGWRIRDISNLFGWKFNYTRKVVASIDKR